MTAMSFDKWWKAEGSTALGNATMPFTDRSGGTDFRRFAQAVWVAAQNEAVAAIIDAARAAKESV